MVKLLPQSQVLRGTTSWMYDGGSFQPFSAEAGLKITPKNEILIVGRTIYAFNESKFVRAFGYDAKKFAVALDKIKEIEKHFKLLLPDGMTLEALVRDNSTLVNKLQKVDPELATQEQLMDYADELGLELMLDDLAENIIIMDAKDATKFINLLNDDYAVSGMTGIRYEIKSKKEVKSAEE